MLENIDHIVVLMLENRSFDCMLGRLYGPDDPPPRNQPFEGIAGKAIANPIPHGVPGPASRSVPASVASDYLVPNVDPGETYEHVQIQLYGDPNAAATAGLGGLPAMNGFVTDYVRALTDQQHSTDYGQYKQIMQGFSPEQLPVLSTLAREYAVCDQWYCSVPSQTWTNRSFLHAADSNGWVDNVPYTKWLCGNTAPTLFNRISEAQIPGLDWCVYYDQLDVLPLTLLIHFPQLAPYFRSNFAYMDQFKADARKGTLPAYSFIEPRYLLAANDQHPPHNVWNGEHLISQVYHALRNGPCWEKTLFIITYDEHGGCFDHVPPSAAVPPSGQPVPGECGFAFDRLGVRVPAILVSPYIEPGTVYRAPGPLDHTSIIRTVCERWGLNGLTQRDQTACSLSSALTRKVPRTDCSTYVSPHANPGPVHSGILNDLQRGMAEALANLAQLTLPELSRAADAADFIRRHADKLGL